MISDSILLSEQQAYLADKLTIESGISEEVLMQNAAASCVEVIESYYSNLNNILIFCGPGNNGGDGFLIADILQKSGKQVRLIEVLKNNNQVSVSFLARANWLKNNTLITDLTDGDIAWADLIIDSIFGIGLSRDIEGDLVEIIDKVNLASKPVLSVDVPTGVETNSGKILGVAIKADITVTFFREKYCHYLEPGRALSGNVIVKDIGITSDVLDVISPVVFKNTSDLWYDKLRISDISDHKFSKGHALILGGEVGKVGAAKLSAISALRSGSGLVTILCNEANNLIYNRWTQSVMCRKISDIEDYKSFITDPRITSVLLGPGSGFDTAVKELVIATLSSRKPCVLDGDIFTIFADSREEFLKLLHQDAVLTPHLGEFARIFDIDDNLSKIDLVSQAAQKANCVILLKGSDSVIADPSGRVVINFNATPLLATAGSGDVLAGIITGLVATGMSVFDASCAGCYIHGEIGQRVKIGAISEDFPQLIGEVLESIMK